MGCIWEETFVINDKEAISTNGITCAEYFDGLLEKEVKANIKKKINKKQIKEKKIEGRNETSFDQ
jgi:hypothetical protein